MNLLFPIVWVVTISEWESWDIDSVWNDEDLAKAREVEISKKHKWRNVEVVPYGINNSK